jgi:predicted DCC family thiol-disulfide oxidoreductase YuxK
LNLPDAVRCDCGFDFQLASLHAISFHARWGQTGARWSPGSRSHGSTIGRADQSRLLAERNPVFGAYDVVQQAWMWSELLVLLFNRTRRALHDFIAGTVVVKVAPAARPS